MECLPLKSEFFKRVAQVLLGTMGAQLISLGVMLLLVRLYTPAELGLYNVWFSFATIMAVVVTGRYELALFSGALGLCRTTFSSIVKGPGYAGFVSILPAICHAHRRGGCHRRNLDDDQTDVESG